MPCAVWLRRVATGPDPGQVMWSMLAAPYRRRKSQSRASRAACRAERGVHAAHVGFSIASKIKMGPGLDPTTEMGPLVSEEQFARVLSGPGQPDRKVVAEPPQLIVPATSTKPQRQAGQVGVLFAEQLSNQIRGDLNSRARHRSNRSGPSSALAGC